MLLSGLLELLQQENVVIVIVSHYVMCVRSLDAVALCRPLRNRLILIKLFN